jgi:hypothetical protein
MTRPGRTYDHVGLHFHRDDGELMNSVPSRDIRFSIGKDLPIELTLPLGQAIPGRVDRIGHVDESRVRRGTLTL